MRPLQGPWECAWKSIFIIFLLLVWRCKEEDSAQLLYADEEKHYYLEHISAVFAVFASKQIEKKWKILKLEQSWLLSIHMRLIQENDSQLIISLLGLILKMRPRQPTLTHSQLLSWQCFRYWPSGDMCLNALNSYSFEIQYFHNVFYLIRFWQERTGMLWCIMELNPREECAGECSALCTSLCSHCLETVSFIYHIGLSLLSCFLMV